MTNKGIVISIGGISCSGKTTLTNRLLEELGKNHNNHLIHVQHISQDDFYDVFFFKRFFLLFLLLFFK